MARSHSQHQSAAWISADPGLSEVKIDDHRARENRFSRGRWKTMTPQAVADHLHAEIAPRSLIEDVLAERIIAASLTMIAEDTPQAAMRLAERSLCRNLDALARIRDRRESLFCREEISATEAWRCRLVMDPEISDSSPVIRGTWITVDQVVSRIIDGWTWDDLLRDHPELTTDDIRACLAFTIEDEDFR